MPDQGPTSNRPDPGSNRLEREESQLWRWALGLLVLLAAAVAALSWEQLKDLPYRLWAIPAGLFLLAILFATYAFGRKREVSELKQILKGFQNQTGVTPSEEQLDQLGQLIMRSQRNFKELIDSLDDAALAISLDGTLRTVNRRTAETLGVPYSELVGHKLEEFLGAPLRAEASGSMERFLEKRNWSGVVEVHLKNDPRRLYYDCVVNAIVKGDDVTGASVLARDITGHREKEQRFSQLFESLQEGVYISTPEGKLLEVNPALVSILGYDSKEDLLNLPPEQLSVDARGEPVLGRAGSQSGRTRTRELRLRKKDGGVAVCVDTSTGVMEEGRLVRYQGTLVDVTEKRAMERQLRRQEEFRQRLLESFPDLILAHDAGYGKSAARCRGQTSGRDHLRSRYDNGEEAGAADYSERTSSGHGADDRRLRTRAQQSADQHSGHGGTAAGRQCQRSRPQTDYDSAPAGAPRRRNRPELAILRPAARSRTQPGQPE